MEDKENVTYCDVLDVPRPPNLPPRIIQRPPEPFSFDIGHHSQRQYALSQNNNTCCRNRFWKMHAALMVAVACLAILSTVFAVINFTTDKNDKACSANSSKVSNVEKGEGMNTTEQKCNYICSSGSWKYLGHGCAGAKGNQYLELAYPGPSVFVKAVKLVHTSGKIANGPLQDSNWGGLPTRIHDLAMFVTDFKNRVIYPSTRLVTIHLGGWYNLTWYSSTSPELVLSDFQNPKYLRNGQKIRIWYGEDLHDYTESNNHGKTCMHVYVYST